MMFLIHISDMDHPANLPIHLDEGGIRHAIGFGYNCEIIGGIIRHILDPMGVCGCPAIHTISMAGLVLDIINADAELWISHIGSPCI
jgi:hypothetical protein